ncbi:MAG: FHA domain-containing protein [Acidobacteriota bacterium]
MKKTSVADIVEKTIDFIERTGADKLAQHYLNYALSSFARGCEEHLAHYMVRYDIQPKRNRPESAQLLVMRDKEVLACFMLDSYANLIGRVDPQTRSYPNIDLSTFDTNAKVSRRHARIYSMDGCNFWIEDLGSFNGTILNGERLVPRRPQPLHDTDRIVFGNTLVSFGSPVIGKPAVKPSGEHTGDIEHRPSVRTSEHEILGSSSDEIDSETID